MIPVVLAWSALAAAVAATLALAGLVGFAFYAAWRIYRPDPPRLERDPATLGLAFAPLAFPSGDGRVQLAGWLIRAPAERARGRTVVLCHQWGAHKGFSLAHARVYHDAGFDVLAFDLRNHGESGYDPGLRVMSRRFTDDVRGAVGAARARPELAGNAVTVHAFSFSTFPAVVAAAEPGPDAAIDALVLDSGPTPRAADITLGFFEAIGARLLPAVLRLPGVRTAFRAVFVFFALRMLATDWPSQRVREAPVPTLVLGGANDVVAHPEAVRAAAAMLARASFVLLPRSKHLTGLRSDRDAYVEAVTAFHDSLGAASARSSAA